MACRFLSWGFCPVHTHKEDIANMKEADLKQQDDYRAFMAIKDKTDAAKFWYAQIADVMGKPYLTPRDYIWYDSPMRARLMNQFWRRWTLFPIGKQLAQDSKEYHCKSLANTLWMGIVWPFMTLEHRKFEKNASLVVSVDIDAMMDHTDILHRWVRSRYAITHERCFLIPDDFAEPQEEWDFTDNLAQIEDREAKGKPDYKILYYWKQVEPATENLSDGRRHIILMDRATHEEAPLLPGQEPYRG